MFRQTWRWNSGRDWLNLRFILIRQMDWPWLAVTVREEALAAHHCPLNSVTWTTSACEGSQFWRSSLSCAHLINPSSPMWFDAKDFTFPTKVARLAYFTLGWRSFLICICQQKGAPQWAGAQGQHLLRDGKSLCKRFDWTAANENRKLWQFFLNTPWNCARREMWRFLLLFFIC